jgi:prefoldin alpha subunit
VTNRLSSKNEEEIRRITVEMRYLEQTAEALQSRLNMLNAVFQDLNFANTTLDSLEKEKENSEILVPIGGTSYIRTKLDTPDKVIVGLGAGVSAEKSRQEAKDIIKKRLTDLEKARTATQQQFVQVAEKINQDRERFEQIAAAVRGENTPPNV